MNTVPVARREIASWALYDFANSGYTTVVLTAVFNAYFVAAVADGATWATFAWTSILAVSYALVMVLGPWVGARADAQAAKKRALAWCTLGCVVSTALLALVGPGAIALAAALIIVSNLCYALGENLNAGFLPELAKSDRIAFISSVGWGIGYLGGLLALAVSLWLIQTLKAQGASAQTYIGATSLAVAFLYALAALPLFMWVKERAAPSGVPPSFRQVIAQSVQSVRSTKDLPDLRRFMICGFFYQAGVSVVITIAAVYAQAVLGFKTEDTIKMLIVVNVAAAIGALAFGWLQDRLGHQRTLFFVLIVWLIAIAVLALKTDPLGFWIAANLAGAGLGACQSGGRALVGYLSPESRHAEMFGVWGVFTRASAIVGPMTYGAIAWATQGNHRLAMLSTGVFFVIALVVLSRVDVGRGRARVAPT